jgi:hypothetical protein
MAIFADLRALGLLRRIARALESIAASQKQAAAQPQKRLGRGPFQYGKIKPAEFGALDVAAASDHYRKAQEARELGVEPDAPQTQ